MSSRFVEGIHEKSVDNTAQVRTTGVEKRQRNGVVSPSEFDFSEIDERKLMRKIDWKLIPWLCVLYLLSFLDRSAIGNAKLYGLQTDLNLTSLEYNICLTVFFFPYALAEVPSNILLKRLSPRIWFPLITFFVGICMMSQGLCTNYAGLLAARFFLGTAEAGLFPGVNYLLSGWYKRNEFGLRAAIFFSAATASGAFGGLLAAAISNMNGVGGYAGWRWIFFIIGLVTALAGILSIWLVQNFPDKAGFLTPSEQAFVIQRLQADQQFSAAGETFKWRQIAKAAVDPKTWMGMVAYAAVDVPLYAFSLFTPTIINQLGYTANNANLISVPIYVFACIITVLVGFGADRYPNRSMFTLVFTTFGIIGYAILIGNDPRVKPGVSYFAIYLAAMGIYPLISNVIALTAGNAEGAYKRSVVSATIISFGNIGGSVSSNVYPASTAPQFRTGHAIILAYMFVGILASTGYLVYCRHQNASRAAGKHDETLLSNEGTSENHEERVIRAKRLREERIRELKVQGFVGKIKALYARLDEGPGGIYADVDEARRMKGDAWSGFHYRH